MLKYNKKFNWSTMKCLTCEGFKRVGLEQCQKNISHVRDKIEEHS